MYGYIYKTTNLINGKIYIGQHRSKYFDTNYFGSGKYLRNALNKYGTSSFSIEIIEQCPDKISLDEKEKYWISYYRNLNCSMYNIANGGEGGDVISGLSEEDKKIRKDKLRKNGYFSNLTPEQSAIMRAKAWETRRKNGNDVFSEEYRQKLSDAHKGHIQSEETRKKISEAFTGEKHPLYGTHRSEETKRKISLKTRGKKVSEETRAKLRIANEGVNNGFYGKTHSDETKKLLGEKTKDRYNSHKIIWINDNVQNKRIDETEFEKYKKLGYKKGRIKWVKH